MDIEPTLAHDTHPPDSRLDGLAAEFASQWSSGGRPQIQEFLSRAPVESRRELLARLMRLEMELQSQSGETFAVRNYREQFADFSDVVEQVLAEQSGTGSSSSKAKPAQASTVGRTQPTADNTSPPKSSGPVPRKKPAAGAAPLLQFGDYEIQSEIARGGMGVVYKARQIKLNRTVALKMILAGQFASDEDVQRFYSEAEAAAKLDHPGIVPIYEVDEFDGRHFFSMAFIDGQSLAQRANLGPLPPRNAAQLVKQVADAVHYAHQHGVIHRDLKPRNILLTAEGQPKVTDFGLAKRVDGGGDLTVSGQAIGTPGYMPPEQAAGKLDQIGPKSDVYSLGGVLYCLLTGRPPFQSSSVVETIKQAIETPPVPPRLLNRSVDRDLETICLKCLEKDPAHRYATAAELSDELQRYLSGEPIKALRAGPVTRGYRWLKRRPLVAALATSLIVLALVVGVSTTFVQRAVRTYRLATLQRSIDERLDAPELTPEWLTETEQLIAALESFDPALPAPAQSRLTAALAERIRSEIRRPKLDESIVRSITAAISLLQSREASLADRLLADLGRRQREWQTTFELQPPFDRAAELLPAGSFQVDAEKRLLAQAAMPLLTTAASEGLVRLEATFDESWEDSRRVGVMLNAQPPKGYDFVLEVSPNQGLSDDDLARKAAAEEMTPPTFRGIRQSDGYYRLAIYRNSRLLFEQQLHHSEIPSGRLTLSATREQGDLRIQVNTDRARTFRDPFPLPSRQAGVFGLNWPWGVGLVSLRSEEKLRATSVSPLEEGDDLYEQGKFAEALEHYQQQALETDDAEFVQESLHKQGMCLLQLGRLEEAAAILQPLLVQEGDRWPPLAGCYLWVIRLRQKRESEADAIFDTLSTRYRLEHFAALIPQELGQEIRSSYVSKLSSLSTLVRHNPDLVRDHERLAAVDRFFSSDGRGDELTQMEVSRAYHLLGDIPNAVQAAEVVARNSRHGTVMRHYVRLLRLNGEPDRALSELQKFRELDTRPGSWENTTLELELARVYAAQGKWQEAEEVIDEMLRRHRLLQPFEPRVLVYLTLIKGTLLDRRGARGPAEEIWREGFLAMRPIMRNQAEPNSEIVNALIQGSLCGELSDEESQAFTAVFMARGGGDSALARQAQAMVNPQTLARALQHMWRTGLGRKYAADFAFEALTLRERVRVPIVLIITEFFNQSIHSGLMTDDQQEVTFDAVGTVYDQAIYEGQVSFAQVAQLILAWKGIANFLGWGGVAPSLPPELRGRLAYVLGHRYVALGDIPQALKFFETAIQDSPPDSALGKIAAADKQLITASQGQLSVFTDFPQPLLLKVRQNGQEVASVEVAGQAEVLVPTGDLEISLAEPRDDCRLSLKTIRIVPGGRRQIKIEWLWAPTPAEPLWGLIPRPASVVAGARWQLQRRYPCAPIRDVQLSRDGNRLAVASRDGLVRVYEVPTGKLAAILTGPPFDLSGLAWGTRLVAAGHDSTVSGWDSDTYQKLFSRKEHRREIRALASSGDHYLSGGANRSLFLWSDAGQITSTWEDPTSDVTAAALSPDGRWAAVRSWSGGGYAIVRVFDLKSENASRVLNDQRESDFTVMSFSSDSRLLVAGSDARGIGLWSTEDWSRRANLELGGGTVNQLLWMPDNRRLLVLSNFDVLQEVDVLAEPPVILRTWKSDLYRLALSPDGKRVVGAAWDGSLGQMDLDSGQVTHFGDVRREILSLARQPGSNLVAAAGVDAVVRLIDEHGRIAAVWEPLPRGRQIVQLAWKPDGSLLAAAVNDKSVVLWRADGSRLATFPDLLHEHVQPIAWSADGKYLVALGVGGRQHRIDPAVEPAAAKTLTDESPAAAVERSDKGLLAIADAQGEIQIVDSTGQELPAFTPSNRSAAKRLDVAATGDRLAVLHHGGDVSLWTLDGRQLAAFQVTLGPANNLAWHPSGQKIAVSLEWRNVVEIRDADGQLERSLGVSCGGRVGALVWLDENRLMAGDENGVVRIWDLTSQRAEVNTVLLAGTDWAAFGASGQLLASAGAVDEQLVYSVESPQQSLELLQSSEFAARIAAASGAASPPLAQPAPAPALPPIQAPAAERAAERLETKQVGTIEEESLAEISGLARCASRAAALWMHNDSGDPLLHLVGLDGKSLLRFDLTDATVFDWEDMAAFRRDGQNYLLIGDIGDNKAGREELKQPLKLFLVKEPAADDPSAATAPLPVERVIEFQYDDGQFDCEALAVDAERNVALLVTKELDAECSLFELPLAVAGDEPVVAKSVAKLPLPLVTAMDISPDGKRLAVLGGVHAFEYVRAAGESWPEALQRVPRRYDLPALEQPEAIAYDREGQSLIVTSEGKNAPLWRLRLPEME